MTFEAGDRRGTGPLRVALVGCGLRGRNVYIPTLLKMPGHFQLVGVCDQNLAQAELASIASCAPAFTSLETLLTKARPDIVVAAVTPPPSSQNEEVALAVINAGVHLLAETPIASTLDGALAIKVAAERAGVMVEFGENYYRTSRERFGSHLVNRGVFGKVHVAYADYVGHGYHGVSVLRSQLGMDRNVSSVIGLDQDYEVEDHEYRFGALRRDRETWQFAVLEFDDGARGVLSFSTLAYGSPLRWGRQKVMTRFYAEKGMRFGYEYAILAEGRRTMPLRIEEIWHDVAGTPVLAAIRAEDLYDGTWENPLRNLPLSDGDQHSELTLGLQCRSLYQAIVNDEPPEYGVQQAFYDRYLDLRIEKSRRAGGVRLGVKSREAFAGA